MSNRSLAPAPLETLSGIRGKKYQLIGRVASGGFGAVYAARDMTSGRRVAVKRLHGAHAEDPGVVARLEGEAHHIRDVHHPNLVAFLDQGRDAYGVPFIVMEWVEGRTIAERIARGPLRPEEAASIGCQVLDGLAAAHARGVVHRDIKPANLIMTPSGLVTAIDFGLAKTGTPAGTPRSEVLIGTPAYMAPEQLDGSMSIDGRVDLYALGITLYEMLAGHPPFRGPQWTDYIREHMFDKPQPLDQVAPGLPPGLVAAIMRSLAKGPADRFATASAMRAALAPFTTPGGNPPARIPPAARFDPKREAASEPTAVQPLPWKAEMAGAPSIAPGDAAVQTNHIAQARPLWLVGLLTLCTAGVYWFVWLGLSWSELRKEIRDPKMSPPGHAFASLVPIYGLFRVHAHFRLLRDLATQAPLGSSINPWLAVCALIAASGLSQVFPLASVPVLIWLTVQGQRSLNCYWRARNPLFIERRPTPAEACVLVVGMLVLLVGIPLALSQLIK